jgi:hypothetical protein
LTVGTVRVSAAPEHVDKECSIRSWLLGIKLPRK